jgi:iron-sulfur cluster assembly accessory protein
MITVTEEAKTYIKSWLNVNENPYMWLSIKSGGCAGFEYDWQMLSREEYEDKRLDGDEIVSLGAGFRLIVDHYAVPYLAESTVDFERSIEKTGIIITNRCATNTCGCGKSISF